LRTSQRGRRSSGLSLIELEPGSWDFWWHHAISSPDEFGYYDFIVREYSFPIAKKYGFSRPAKLAGFMMHAGAFPDWFQITVFNHIKGVLAMRRRYTLDQMMRLIEGRLYQLAQRLAIQPL
jgi:hypothetical protein